MIRRLLLVCIVAALPLVAFAADDQERYIVVFKDGIGPNAHAALRSANAIKALDLPEHRAVAAYMKPQAAEALARNPNVELVEVDPKRYPLAWSNSTSGGETTPYGIKAVEANLLSAGVNINSCAVCIIDSGYFKQHDDLQDANVIAAPQSTENVFEDGCGHGSHVAGTVAALANSNGVIGVNSGGALKIVVSRVFANDCAWSYASSLIKALDACKAKRNSTNGITNMVISMSLGGSFKSRTEDQAFAKANTEGFLSIAAAGNDGNSRVSYPAGYTSVMSVAAIDANEAKATFSQYNSDVEIAAPGVSVLSTVPWIGSSLTANSVKYLGSHIANSATTDGVSGGLVSGGLCDSVGAWSGQTVLCQRGTVSFKTKVDNVKAGGGVAAVIYNNVSGGFAGTCDDGTGTTCAGVGIGISKEDGDYLVANALGVTGTTTASVSPNCGDGKTVGCGYEAWDGTSMATPHVSAVAALIWSHNVGKTNAQVRDAMNKTAKDLGAAGRDTNFGWGLVKAARANACLAGTGPCTPSTSPLP